ncbi:hypothetical protein CEXT_18881 [Caerostris extrusa]|uniref:DUF5641 domain-containing protein n=1 Tax=Caerostris extrusa TaxID=172846 RepID=A0AAV4NZ84_CAEEX|nr:hypothetical protein CEXT_18881 [Caerostris extrusa]
MEAVSTIFRKLLKRWLLDYLSQLQGRIKWLRDKLNLMINNLVLIKDDNLHILKWILELNPGIDGKVHVAKLKVSLGKLKHSIHKLSFLPFSN